MNVFKCDSMNLDLIGEDMFNSCMTSYFIPYIGLNDMLDKALKTTHFGINIGRRKLKAEMPRKMIRDFKRNIFLRDLVHFGNFHLGTQGEGDSFLSFGISQNRNQPCMTTRCGSKVLGRKLRERGLNIGLIDRKTSRGRDFLNAFSAIGDWTRLNHFLIHDAMLKDSMKDNIFSIHNGVNDDFIHFRDTILSRGIVTGTVEDHVRIIDCKTPTHSFCGRDDLNGLDIRYYSGRVSKRPPFHKIEIEVKDLIKTEGGVINGGSYVKKT